MGWREAWRLSSVAFTELSLQAIYAFRQGNPVPATEGRELVPRARRRVLQSKGMIAVLLGLLTLGAGALLRLDAGRRAIFVGYALPTGTYQTAVLTGLFSLDLALLWWTGLQALPTLLTSGVLEVLEPLPLSRATLRRVALIVYLRLFDLPVVTVLLLTPVTVGWALGPWSGLAAVPGAVSASALALALSLVTGRFFVRRVHGSGGGGGRTLLRWAYLVLWVVPAFAILGFVTLSPLFFGELWRLSYGRPFPFEASVLFLYPFPMAALPPLTATDTSSLGLVGSHAGLFAAGAVVYGALAAWSVVWLYRSVVRLGTLPAQPAPPARSSPRPIRPSSPALSVLTKDLRIASRTPGYAFLILLPLLDSVALGLVSVVGAPGTSAATGLAFGAVTSAALLATFFGPAFFALEVLAHSYSRTLPLSQRSVVLGKSSLVVAIYLAASGVVLGITLSRVAAGALFAEFVLAMLPAVLAASMLELGLLFLWSRRRGQPVTNLYAGALNVVLISIPGLAVVAAPLVLFRLVGLDGMVVAAVAALAGVAPFALGRRGL